MYKKIFYIAILTLWSNALHAAKVYTEMPALIHLNKLEQEDTNGFNLVEYLPSLIYKSIHEGSLKLWDSPKKQIVISPEALKDIERSNGVSFQRAEHLFINELWTGTRRKTEFVIIGFSFLAESSKGKISFGYVDITEAMQILGSNFIPCNVNGPAQLTYLDALYSRRYQFNLLQFGSKDFTVEPSQSITIKRDAFYSKKKVNGLFKIPNTKMVTYVMDKNVGLEGDPGTATIIAIEKYLNENKEVLFNIGGNKYFDYQNRLFDVTITRIEIAEIWTKKGTSITYSPFQIIIYANNKPLNVLTFEDIAKWQLLINFKTLEDILMEKSFQYTLYKINKDLIYSGDSQIYLKALREYKWSQVSNYVKYSRN